MPRVAQVLTLPLIMYAREHQGWLPTNFVQTLTHFTNAFELDPFLQDTEELIKLSKNFEIVYQGNLGALEDPGNVLLIRTTGPLPTADGWAKFYGFADGHGQAHAQRERDFQAWEKQFIVSEGAVGLK